jgi:hypothetical protein
MTPQEKASILVNRFYDKIEDVESVDGGGWSSNSYLLDYSVKLASKQCALVAVDEILKASPSKPIESDNGSYSSDIIESIEYWQEVKTEIEKL